MLALSLNQRIQKWRKYSSGSDGFEYAVFVTDNRQWHAELIQEPGLLPMKSVFLVVLLPQTS